MAQTTKTRAEPTARANTRQNSSGVLRTAVLLVWLAFFLSLATHAANLLGAKFAPRLLDLLPKLLVWLSHQPLWVQVPVVLLTVAALVLIGWITWLAVLTKRSEKDLLTDNLVTKVQEAVEEVVEREYRGRAKSRPLSRPAPPLLTAADDLGFVATPSSLPRPEVFEKSKNVGDLIENLKATLQASHGVGVIALNGMFGVGKSALAAEIAGQLLEDDSRATSPAFPGGIAWIGCAGLEGKEGLARLWTNVADELSLHAVANISSQDERKRALTHALGKRQRTLLVLDNIEPNLGRVRPRNWGIEQAKVVLYVPSHTVLLITARVATDLPGVRREELHELVPPAAAQLFLKELTLKDNARPTAQDKVPRTAEGNWDVERQSALTQIIQSMGGLPLVITRLASYAAVQHRYLPNLLDDLKLADAPADVKEAVDRSVYLSWKVLSTSQQRLFAGLSLMTRDVFPREAARAMAIAAIASVQTQGGSTNPQDDVDALVNYALIEALADGTSYKLHRQLRVFGAARLKSMTSNMSAESKVLKLLGIAATTYWFEYAKTRDVYPQMNTHQVRVFVSSQLRRSKQKPKWLDQVVGPAI